MPFYSIDYMKKVYFEGDEKVLKRLRKDNDINDEELYFSFFLMIISLKS